MIPRYAEDCILYKNLDYACQVMGMRTSGVYEQYVPVLMVVARCWPKAA